MSPDDERARPRADEIGHETISQRAYEISQSDQTGTPEENWERAERELRERAAPGPADEP
jgi:hypothetical protein